MFSICDLLCPPNQTDLTTHNNALTRDMVGKLYVRTSLSEKDPRLAECFQQTKQIAVQKQQLQPQFLAPVSRNTQETLVLPHNSYEMSQVRHQQPTRIQREDYHHQQQKLSLSLDLQGSSESRSTPQEQHLRHNITVHHERSEQIHIIAQPRLYARHA